MCLAQNHSFYIFGRFNCNNSRLLFCFPRSCFFSFCSQRNETSARCRLFARRALRLSCCCVADITVMTAERRGTYCSNETSLDFYFPFHEKEEKVIKIGYPRSTDMMIMKRLVSTASYSSSSRSSSRIAFAVVKPTTPTVPKMLRLDTAAAASAAIVHSRRAHSFAMGGGWSSPAAYGDASTTMLWHNWALDPSTVVGVEGGDDSDGIASSASSTPPQELSRAETHRGERQRLHRIVCTIGPSSAKPAVLDAMIQAGMDIARINCSHGDHDSYRRVVALVRDRARRLGVHVAVALDTKGPEVRLGSFQSGVAPLVVNKGQEVGIFSHTLTAADSVVDGNDERRDEGTKSFAAVSPPPTSTSSRWYVHYPPGLSTILRRGSRVLIADGALELEVLDAPVLTTTIGIRCDEARCVVRCGSTISGRNNVHFPGSQELRLPNVSQADVLDLQLAVELDVDAVFASFTRSASFVHEVRQVLVDAQQQRRPRQEGAARDDTARDNGTAAAAARDIWIIAKVENVEGVRRINEIVDAADGIMVARGDLGVDIALERVFLAQKLLIARAVVAAKPVICATQMLESMVNHNRPTRAEATDVAAAVVDGADAVMLSAESASGEFPVEAVSALSHVGHIAMAYESPAAHLTAMLSSPTLPTIATTNKGDLNLLAPSSQSPDQQARAMKATGITASPRLPMDPHDAVARAAVLSSFSLGAACVMTATVSGRSVRLLRRYGPRCPIVAVCSTERMARKLLFVKGVVPLYFPHIAYGDFDQLVDAAVRLLSNVRPSDVDDNFVSGDGRTAKWTTAAALGVVPESGTPPPNASIRPSPLRATFGLCLYPTDRVIVTCTDVDGAHNKRSSEAFLRVREV